MGDKLIGQMDSDEFDELVRNFIETQSGCDDPLPGEMFFELWAEIEGERESGEVITLQSAEDSFRQGWQEVMRGKTTPLDELWLGIGDQ